MPVFTVTTWESVLGTYEVDAPTEQDARARFTPARPDLLIDWDGVEQVGYMAFDVEVREVNAR